MQSVATSRRGWIPGVAVVLWSTILLHALLAPHVILPRQTRAATHQITDLTGMPVMMAPPARRLVDLQDELPAYLATGGDLRYLAAISPVPVLQSEQAGFKLIRPALSEVHTERFGRAPDIESLLLLDPDAIIAPKYAASMLRELGFPGVLALSPAADIPSRRAAWQMVGEIDGREAVTRILLTRYDAQVSDLREATRGLPDARAVILFGGYNYWTIAGRGYYLNDILKLAHVANLASTSVTYSQVNLEQLLLLDPDVIFLNAQPGDHYTPETLYRDPSWQVLRAVRERRVYKLPGFAVFLGPMEQVLLARWLAELTHPGIPAQLRDLYRSSYLLTYSCSLDDSLIDRELNVSMNVMSEDSGRFVRPR